MFRFQSSKFLKLTIAAAAFISQTVFAAPVNFSGELTQSDPVFNRPLSTNVLSAVGTRVSYDIYGFQVSADGIYSIASTSFSGQNEDTYLYIYGNAFDPSSPLSNLLAFDDDSGNGLLSLVSGSLNSGNQYYLVFASYYNDSYGTYTGRFDTVSGNGQVSLSTTAVPEPGSLALLGLGLVGFAASRRKSAKSKNA